MPSASVRLTMHGVVGSISLAEFGVLLSAFQGVTDAVAGDQDVKNAVWRVTDLGIGSADALATLDTAGDPGRLALTVVGGLAAVQGEAKIPPGLPLAALTPAAAIGRAARTNAVTLSVVRDDGVVAQIDHRLATNANVAKKQKSISLGGYYGTIDTIAERRGKRFGLRDEFTHRAISCRSATDEIQDRALGLVRHRVYVGGQISENAAHQPLSIEVTAIEDLPWASSSPRDFLGADSTITDGRSAADFIRSQRDW